MAKPKMLRTVLSISFLLCLCWPAHAETITGRVVSIADGDTLTVLDPRNAQHKVRLAGIDAPESGQPFGQASKRNLSALAFGKQVSIETKKTDRYGRAIGLVTFDGQDVNLAQLKTGLAWFYRQYASELDTDRRTAYERAEREAREARRGLWAEPSPVAPWEYRHPEAKSETKAGAPGAAEKSAAPIIGNRNSMIYHRPDCPDYEKVSERNRVPFKTEGEAQAAGYRRARNCQEK